MTLPEMSVIDTHLPSNHKTRAYTTEQMLAWGKATAEAEREACARLVVGLFDPEDAIAEAIAEAILARGNT
jgi:hypothetical protein